MGLSELKAEIAADPEYKDLTEDQWEDKIRGCEAHRRHNHILTAAIKVYARKVPKLRKMILDGVWVKTENPDGSLKSVAEVMVLRADAEADINTKIERLLDKFAACEKELKKRKDGNVVRENLV